MSLTLFELNFSMLLTICCFIGMSCFSIFFFLSFLAAFFFFQFDIGIRFVKVCLAIISIDMREGSCELFWISFMFLISFRCTIYCNVISYNCFSCILKNFIKLSLFAPQVNGVIFFIIFCSFDFLLTFYQIFPNYFWGIEYY